MDCRAPRGARGLKLCSNLQNLKANHNLFFKRHPVCPLTVRADLLFQHLKGFAVLGDLFLVTAETTAGKIVSQVGELDLQGDRVSALPYPRNVF